MITKVHAIDLDSSDNGEVRYELIKGHGELFKVQRESGDIEIKQNLEGHNREYELLIAAYDKGTNNWRAKKGQRKTEKYALYLKNICNYFSKIYISIKNKEM